MKTAVLLLFLLAHIPCLAQRECIYTFENNLEESSNKLPPLRVLGTKGEFKEDYLPELKVKRLVYNFDKNCGLQFDNKAAKGFLDGSYTIEIYFRFEDLASWRRVIDYKNRKTDYGCYVWDGKVNFYNFALGENAPVRASEYTHYVVSRDVVTKKMKMYVDGQSKKEFIDKTNEGIIDDEGLLNFFYDDLMVKDEASEGAVAYIKIYDYVVEALAVKQSFNKLNSINQTLSTSPQTPRNNYSIKTPPLPPPPTPPKTTEAAIDPTKPYELTASLQNLNNKVPVQSGTVLVLDSNMVENQRVDIKNGKFKITINPKEEYNLIVEAPGFLPGGIHIATNQLQKKRRYETIFALAPVAVGEAVLLNDLFFVQSKAELLPESRLELNKLLEFMKNNPKAEIELQGHTDNQGDFDLNLQLSKQRVETIKSYLVQKGIVATRVTGRGFGASRPIANNNYEETRKKNRRVELVITKY
jgi:OmpA-OmpF porin, OOP family